MHPTPREKLVAGRLESNKENDKVQTEDSDEEEREAKRGELGRDRRIDEREARHAQPEHHLPTHTISSGYSFKNLTRKPRPESGRDCLMCAMFPRVNLGETAESTRVKPATPSQSIT